MKVWWIAYNTKVFEGALPMPIFRVQDIEHYGEYDYEAIVLSSRISTLDAAKATLLHEMVHQWQHLHNKPVDHGHEFQTWRELILSATKLEI
jgi:hypothetical protein